MKTNKKIIRKYKMVCPFCSQGTFLRRNSDLIKITEIGDETQEEIIANDVEDFEYFCAECGKDLTNEELKVVR